MPIFIESLYFKKLRKERPENVLSIEQMVKDKRQKQVEHRRRKLKAGEGQAMLCRFEKQGFQYHEDCAFSVLIARPLSFPCYLQFLVVFSMFFPFQIILFFVLEAMARST